MTEREAQPGDRADPAHPAHPDQAAHAAQEVRLTIHELAAACRIEPGWVIERVRAGLIEVGDPDRPEQWQFADLHLTRVRCMVTMERDMDANPEVAALVADLVAEVRQLRARLTGRG